MKFVFSIFLFSIIFSFEVGAQRTDDEGFEGRQDSSQWNSKVTVDSIKLRVSVLSLREDMLSYDSIPFDTLLENIHLQNQFYKKFTSYSFLGNVGLATKSNNYYQNIYSNDFFFTDPVKYNLIHKEDVNYYQTNHPYSNISYNSSWTQSVDMQDVRFIHTQNVNKDFNVGTLLKLHSSNGFYQNQKSNANALSLFSSYNGDYYSLNAVVSYNTLKNDENGGLALDSLFEKDKDKGTVYPTVFDNATMSLRNTYIFINQRYNLAGLRDVFSKDKKDSIRKFSGIGILHTFEFDRNKRKYLDESGVSGSVDYNYYSQYNVDSTATNDSLYFLRIRNSLELLLGKQDPNKAPMLIRAGLKSLYDNYRYTIQPDTVFFVNSKLVADTTYKNRYYHNNYNNVAFTGGISLGIRSFFLLNANADYFFTGYKAGDLYLHGKLTNKFSKKLGSPSFNIVADISRYKPGYFYDRYFSNHYSWNNEFIPVKEVHTGFEFVWPAINFDVDFNYSLISSPVYFDENAFPDQSGSEVSVLEGSISKGFHAGILYSIFKGTFQLTSDDKIIPLPLISAYNSSYVELKLFKKVMTTQVGYDLRYNSTFYANGYSPDLGVFYNQRSKKMGNYPFADLFLNVKLKRMRFFIKFEHVNSDMLSRNYYTALHYPLYSRMLMYGLSWNFYD